MEQRCRESEKLQDAARALSEVIGGHRELIVMLHDGVMDEIDQELLTNARACILSGCESDVIFSRSFCDNLVRVNELSGRIEAI